MRSNLPYIYLYDLLPCVAHCCMHVCKAYTQGCGRFMPPFMLSCYSCVAVLPRRLHVRVFHVVIEMEGPGSQGRVVTVLTPPSLQGS